MRGLNMLRSMLHAVLAPRLRAANDDEVASILSVVKNMSDERLRSVTEDDLKIVADDAAEDGLDISMIGARIDDIEIDGGCFSIRCQLRFGRRPVYHDIMLTGTIDDRARVSVDHGHLMTTRRLLRTA